MKFVGAYALSYFHLQLNLNESVTMFRSIGPPEEKPLRVRDLPFDYVCKLDDK